MSYRWLLFDVDGTLFDFDAAEMQALEWTFEQMGYDYVPEYGPIYRTINTTIWDDLEKGHIQPGDINTLRFTRLFDEVGIEHQHTDLHAFGERYLGNLARGTQLLDGVDELIAAVKGEYKLALITNGLKDVQRLRLDRSTLRGVFEPIIISEEVGASKPGRVIFDVAFSEMGDPAKSDVLIIGDSLSSDITGGSNYGIDTCWFNPKAKPADPAIRITYEISHIQELLSILNGEG